MSVAAYDALRATEGAALGANVQTSYSEVAGRYGHQSTTKDANFNRDGVVRARNASKALTDATPEIDWAAIAKAEANDPAAAAFGRATRNRRYIMLGALALVIASPFLYVMWQHHEQDVKREERQRAWDSSRTVTPPPRPAALPEPERAALMTRVTQLKAAYDTALQSWATATSPEALAAIKLGTQPCSKRVMEPGSTAADTFIQTGDVDEGEFATTHFRGYMAGTAPIPDEPLVHARAVLDRIDRELASRPATPRDKDVLAELVPIEYMFVVIDRSIEPDVTATAPIAYKPGSVTGRGYLYSVLSAKVLCVADIAAKNPPAESQPAFLAKARRAREISDALHRQLEVAIRRELAANLRAAP